jgi:hypothetical protein
MYIEGDEWFVNDMLVAIMCKEWTERQSHHEVEKMQYRAHAQGGS